MQKLSFSKWKGSTFWFLLITQHQLSRISFVFKAFVVSADYSRVEIKDAVCLSLKLICKIFQKLLFLSFVFLNVYTDDYHNFLKHSLTKNTFKKHKKSDFVIIVLYCYYIKRREQT